MKPVIRYIQEEDGRWLAWCEEPCVASYGQTIEMAKYRALECIQEIIDENDPDFAFSIPSDEEADYYGREFVKILSRWTGIPIDVFIEESEKGS